jgi:hypothetical protein
MAGVKHHKEWGVITNDIMEVFVKTLIFPTVFLVLGMTSLIANGQTIDDKMQEIRDINNRRNALEMAKRPAIKPNTNKKLSKEARAALTPAKDVELEYRSFLNQKQTGIAKLLPRKEEKEQMITSTKNVDVFIPLLGGGAYYSFSERRQIDGYEADIYLGNDRFFTGPPESDTFWTGFGGTDIGFITKLGDVNLDDVTLNRKEARYLFEYIAPDENRNAREQQKKNLDGFKVNDVFYKSSARAEVNSTYLLRSIGYNRSDLIVAFKAVRKEADGGYIIVWKILKRNKIPILKR